MLSTADFYNGLKIEIDGEVWVIVEFQHRRSAQGQAFLKTKIKNLKSGEVLEKTFKAGEKFHEPNLETRKTEYLYSDSGQYYFMDKENYEQIVLSKDTLGEKVSYLKENILVEILFHNGNVIGVDLPTFVEMEVLETEPGARGDTVGQVLKQAKVESGAIVSVPLFINVGDRIKIDTRTGQYVERAK